MIKMSHSHPMTTKSNHTVLISRFTWPSLQMICPCVGQNNTWTKHMGKCIRCCEIEKYIIQSLTCSGIPTVLNMITKCHNRLGIHAHFMSLTYRDNPKSWWRHQMETFSALLAICAGNSPVHDEFPAQRPVTRRFDVFFDMRPNKRLSKQSWGWWFETSSRSLWRHRNG